MPPPHESTGPGGKKACMVTSLFLYVRTLWAKARLSLKYPVASVYPLYMYINFFCIFLDI